MAKKSAARVKTIKAEKGGMPQQPALPPIEETFKYMKDGFVTILETSVTLAKRADNLANCRDYALGFWKDAQYEPTLDIKYFKELQKLSIETYEKLLERAESFDLEEFKKQDMKDYFSDLIPTCDDILSEKDLCAAEFIFIIVKPFGEKMSAMHQSILDEIKQREFIEKGDE